jgi:hypothetical protein
MSETPESHPANASGEKPCRSATRRFFVIDRGQFHTVCGLGMAPAIAYLVMAAGTGPDHSLTSWGVHSIEKYSGLSRGRAGDAIELLRKHDLLKKCGKPLQIGTRTLQRRRLVLPARTKRHLVWLPTQLVTGAGREQTPLDIVREVGDVLALRLLVDLYDVQNLPEHWGINSSIIRQSWNRKKVGERGEWVIWGFENNSLQAWKNETTEPHIKRERPKDNWEPLWDRIHSLTHAGLIEWIPTLVGSSNEDTQPIMPVGGSLEPEILIRDAIRDAAWNTLTEWQMDRVEDNLLLVPVRRHLSDCQVVGIARTKYRTQTKRTSQWFAQIYACVRQYLPVYQKLAGKKDMQDQGLFNVPSMYIQG